MINICIVLACIADFVLKVWKEFRHLSRLCFSFVAFRASQQKSVAAKTTPQASARSGKADVASAKRQDRKKIPAARDQSPTKNGGQYNKPTKEKTYKTLWKTNQMNLFDDNRRWSSFKVSYECRALGPNHTNAFLKVSVFFSTKTKQKIFAHTSVLFSPVHTDGSDSIWLIFRHRFRKPPFS